MNTAVALFDHFQIIVSGQAVDRKSYLITETVRVQTILGDEGLDISFVSLYWLTRKFPLGSYHEAMQANRPKSSAPCLSGCAQLFLRAWPISLLETRGVLKIMVSMSSWSRWLRLWRERSQKE